MAARLFANHRVMWFAPPTLSICEDVMSPLGKVMLLCRPRPVSKHAMPLTYGVTLYDCAKWQSHEMTGA